MSFLSNLMGSGMGGRRFGGRGGRYGLMAMAAPFLWGNRKKIGGFARKLFGGRSH